MKASRKWNRVLVGNEAPSVELARFAAAGDAFSYAQELAGREGMGTNVWFAPASGIFRKVSAI